MCTIGEKDYDFRKPVLHTPSAHTDAFLGLSSKGSLGREDLSLGLERPRQLSTPNYRGALAPLTVDTEGDPLGIRVVPADVHEHRALRALAPDLAAHPTLRLAWLDRGFAGEEPEAFLNRHGIAAEVVGIKDRRGFELEKRRWKAEQTFGCLQRYRRLRVDDEGSCETSRGMAMLAALFMTGMRLERLITS
jgi:transposase